MKHALRIHAVLALMLVFSMVLQPILPLYAQDVVPTEPTSEVTEPVVEDSTAAPVEEETVPPVTEEPTSGPVEEETTEPVIEETEPVLEETAPVEETPAEPTEAVEEATVPATTAPTEEQPAQPMQTAETTNVTFALSSSDPAYTQLAGTANYTVSSLNGGRTLYVNSGTGANLALPQDYNGVWLRTTPQGETLITFDGGPEFEPWSQTVTISGETQVIPIVLTPRETVATGVFNFTFTSADPTFLNKLPVGTSFTVYNSDGTQVFRRAGLATYLPQTVQAPAFTGTPLPFGDYRVVVIPPSGFERYDAIVTLNSASQAESIVLQPIKPMYTGTVTVVDADGVTPVSGATVTLSSGASVTTGADGIATFADLADGTYDVTVTAADGRVGAGSLVVAGANANVTVKLPAVFTQLVLTYDCPTFTEPVKRGDVVTFTLNITNNSNVTISSTRSTIYQNGTRINHQANPPIPTSLAPGQSVTATVTYPLTDMEVSQGWLYGTAQVNGYRPDGTAITGRESLRKCTFAPLQSMVVSAVCPEIPAGTMAGDTVTIPVSIENTGETNLVSPVVSYSRGEPDQKVLTTGPDTVRVVNYTTTVTQADVDAGAVTGDITVTVKHNYAGTLVETISINCAIPVATYTGTIAVVDADGTTPIVGATVALADGQTATTGAEGTVAFADLPNGEYAVTVTAADGRTAAGTLTIANADGSTTITLAAVVTKLEIELLGCPDLTNARVGDTVTLHFTATNTGNVEITSVTGRSYNQGAKKATPANPALPRTLAPGERFTSSATYVIHQEDTYRGFLYGSVGVYGYRPSGTAINDTQTLSGCAFAPYQNFELSAMCPDIPAGSQVGDEVSVPVTVTNTGDTRLLTPEETWNRTETPGNFLTIGYGKSATRTFTTVLTAEDIAAGQVQISIGITARDSKPGPMTQTIEINCAIAPMNYNGTVIVVDTDGTTPIEGATVTLGDGDDDDANNPTATTAADGTANFADLLNGEYPVTVTAADGRTATGMLVVNDADGSVTITLPAPTYTAVIKVVEADGVTPVVGATVDFNPTGTTNEEGTVTFEGVENGEYVVTATAPDGRVASETMVVQDAPVELLIVMPAATYTGTVTVVDADGTTPIEGATVTLGDDDDDDTNNLTATTSADGVVSFAELPNGEYQVTVTAADGRTVTGVLTISDDDGSVTLQLPAVDATPSPTPDVTPSPAPTETPGATPVPGDDDPADDKDDAKKDPADTAKSSKPAKVSGLPSTGTGESSESSILPVMGAAAAAMVAGFVWQLGGRRQKR